MKTRFGLFLEFAASDASHIAYYDSTKCFSAFGYVKRSCIINEVCIINVIYAKNEVFGHFLEFGTSDGPNIAYYDNPKCFSPFGCDKRSCIIN